MSVTRIYVVLIGNSVQRLVEAGSAAQAIRHCVRDQYSAKAAAPKEIAHYMAGGMRIEQASGDSETATATAIKPEQATY